jgi:acetoin utilization deacetylase AcuC-like enzyme
MEAVMSAFENRSKYIFNTAKPASDEDILLTHSQNHFKKIKEKALLFEMAMLAAGAACSAAEFALFDNGPVFASIRPPGHHASRDSSWGYCAFCNLAVALNRLRSRGQIQSALILDFDAHTGDGTIDCLSDWPDVTIINPYADDNLKYIKLLEERLSEIDHSDIIAVSAGFDTYIHDVGRKLETFDFYQIGRLLKKTCMRMGHNKRFAVLEGGYYHQDLGKNVRAFCDGFE